MEAHIVVHIVSPFQLVGHMFAAQETRNHAPKFKLRSGKMPSNVLLAASASSKSSLWIWGIQRGAVMRTLG